MKQLTIILLVTLSLSKGTNAQVHFGMGAGYDVQTSLPIADINAGAQIGNIMMEGQIKPSISRNAAANNYIGFKAGYALLFTSLDDRALPTQIIPSVGYYYNHVSSDKPSLNGWFTGFSLKATRMINDRGGLFAEGLYIHKSFQLTAGIHYKFN